MVVWTAVVMAALTVAMLVEKKVGSRVVRLVDLSAEQSVDVTAGMLVGQMVALLAVKLGVLRVEWKVVMMVRMTVAETAE